MGCSRLVVLGLVLHSLLSGNPRRGLLNYASFHALASPIHASESNVQTVPRVYDDIQGAKVTATHWGGTPVRRNLHGRFLHITDIVSDFRARLRFFKVRQIRGQHFDLLICWTSYFCSYIGLSIPCLLHNEFALL